MHPRNVAEQMSYLGQPRVCVHVCVCVCVCVCMCVCDRESVYACDTGEPLAYESVAHLCAVALFWSFPLFSSSLQV